MFRNTTLWVWGLLLCGFVVANGFFIYFAQQSNPGLVSENYYERGQDYEKNLIKRRGAQTAWQGQLKPPLELRKGVGASFELVVVGPDGVAPEFEQVTLYAYRPTNAGEDFFVPMKAMASGRYHAEVTFPLPGAWDLLATSVQAGEEHSIPLRVRVAD